MEPGIDVVVIPHLYDLKPDGTGLLALQGIMGNMVVLSWLYDRAARWTLDRFGIRGRDGLTTIKVADDDEDEAEEDDAAEAQEPAEAKQRVIDIRQVPNRRIYCIDLRVHSTPQPYIDEVKRIARENSMQLMGLDSWIGGSPKPEQMQRFLQPTNDTALGPPVEIKSSPVGPPSPALPSDAPHVNAPQASAFRTLMTRTAAGIR